MGLKFEFCNDVFIIQYVAHAICYTITIRPQFRPYARGLYRVGNNNILTTPIL